MHFFYHYKMILLIHFSRSTPINRRVAPNLRRLNIKWNGCIMTVKSINELFERDVLFSLTNFVLVAQVDAPCALRNLLSMLSSQCLYSFNVNWFVRTVMTPLERNKLLSDTFEQLKGPVPIELKLFFEKKHVFY